MEGFVIDVEEAPIYYVGDTGEITPADRIDEYPIFVVVEFEPEYPGGDEARIKFIRENLVYPQEAIDKKIEGRVFIGFVIEVDGSLTNFSILRSVHPLLDEEALRVIKLMPKWIPGELRGKPVRVQFQMPITFTLE